MSVDILATEGLGPSDLGDEIDFLEHGDGDASTRENPGLAGQEDLDEITYDANDGLVADFPSSTRARSDPDDGVGDGLHDNLDDTVTAGGDPLSLDFDAAAFVSAHDVFDGGFGTAAQPHSPHSEVDLTGRRDGQDGDDAQDGQDDGAVDKPASPVHASFERGAAIEEDYSRYDQDVAATSKAWLPDDASTHSVSGEQSPSSLKQSTAPSNPAEADDTKGEDDDSDYQEPQRVLGDPSLALEAQDGETNVLEQANDVDSGYDLDDLDEESHHDSIVNNGEVDDMVLSRPDSSDFSDRPDVRVCYRRTEYSLFSKSDSDDPYTYFFSDVDALDYPLSQFLDSLHEVINEEISRDDELVIRVEGLGLEFSETMDKKLLDQTTFGKIIDLHNQLVQNDGSEGDEDYTVVVFLVTRPHCSRRLEALLEGARSGYGLESLRFSYPRYLTKDVSPVEDEEAGFLSDASEDDQDVAHDGQDEEDEDGVNDEDGSPDQDAESGVAQPHAEDNELLLGDSYDQVVDETAQDGSLHSGYSGIGQPSVADTTEQDAGGDTVSGDVFVSTEGEEHEGHAQFSSEAPLRSEQPGPDIDGAVDVGEDEDDHGELWYGQDSGVGEESNEVGLDFDSEHYVAQASGSGQIQDQEAVFEDQSHAIDDATDAGAAQAAEEIEVWGGNDLGEDANPPRDDEVAAGSEEAPHDDLEVRETALHAESDSLHNEWDVEQELDFDATAAVADVGNDALAPTSTAPETTSGQSSASATLNGDEIDFEVDDGLAVDTLTTTADDGHDHPADTGHHIDPDEIDWEDHDVVAVGAGASASTPSSVAGKRGRELDDSEGSGEGHDVKRHRA